MPNLLLTTDDNIIDLDHVIAITIDDAQGNCSCLQFHLATGTVITSSHGCREGAIEEKWRAYQQLKPIDLAMHPSVEVERVRN